MAITVVLLVLGTSEPGHGELSPGSWGVPPDFPNGAKPQASLWRHEAAANKKNLAAGIVIPHNQLVLQRSSLRKTHWSTGDW